MIFDFLIDLNHIYWLIFYWVQYSLLQLGDIGLDLPSIFAFLVGLIPHIARHNVIQYQKYVIYMYLFNLSSNMMNIIISVLYDGFVIPT